MQVIAASQRVQDDAEMLIVYYHCSVEGVAIRERLETYLGGHTFWELWVITGGLGLSQGLFCKNSTSLAGGDERPSWPPRGYMRRAAASRRCAVAEARRRAGA
eukprot:6214672-Pleurochrysis_carterae.AAC.1